MAVNPNMANREVADLVLLDYKTKKVFLPIDFANVTTTDFTANRVFAKGGQGAPNRVGFDGERAGTLKVDTQIMPVKLFALLSGQDIGKIAKIMKREVLTATTDGIELSETPKAGTVPTASNIIHGGLSGGCIYPFSKTRGCPLCRCCGVFGSNKTLCKPRCKRINQGKISA